MQEDMEKADLHENRNHSIANQLITSFSNVLSPFSSEKIKAYPRNKESISVEIMKKLADE